MVRPFFSVILRKSVGVDKVLKFDRVTLNKGSCYDQRTGRFTASRSGKYKLSVTVISYYGERSLYLYLYKNNEMLINLIGVYGKELRSDTANVIIELKKGDTIFVRNEFVLKAWVNGDDTSHMSGFYIGK